MILTIRPATPEDAEYLSTHLRGPDKREVETATGLPAGRAVPFAHLASALSYSIRLTAPDGRVCHEPAVLFGVCPDPSIEDIGVIWLLATDAIHRAPISICREAQHWLDEFTRIYPEGLHNYVDARNDLHVRWLKLFGFEVLGDQCINGQTFHHVFRNNVRSGHDHRRR